MGKNKSSKAEIRTLPRRAWGRLRRLLYQRFRLDAREPKQIGFVVGCQRSGTSMLLKCFQKDLRAMVFGESSAFTGHPEKLDDSHRLKPFDEIQRIIERQRAHIIITKPLVDTQNVPALFDTFEGSKAIWMYRHYKDVVNSYLVKWGEDMPKKNLRVVVTGERPGHWVVENMHHETKQVVLENFREEMPPQDSAALFWYVRNHLFYDLDLDQSDRVLSCNYDAIATDAPLALRCMYEHLGKSYPGDQIADHIHSRSVRRGKDIEITSRIEDLCKELLARLQTAERAVPLPQSVTG